MVNTCLQVMARLFPFKYNFQFLGRLNIHTSKAIWDLFSVLGRLKIETSKVIWADRCVHVNPGAAQEASGEINEKHLARVTEY